MPRLTFVSSRGDGFHYAGTRHSRKLFPVVTYLVIPGVAMNPSIKIVLNRIATLVVVTLAVAAVSDWSGLLG